MRLILAGAAMIAAAGAVGCRSPRGDGRAVEPYAGPTDPMVKVVADVNANSAAIPTLWARHYFAGTIVDERGKSTYVNTEGLLLMSRPRSVRMVGRKPGATVFDMGTDGTRFWMSVPIEVDTMWWGRNKNIGKPCVRAGIPIQPDGIFEVLGVGGFDAGNLNQPPVPVMRFNAASDAYVFVWNRPLADRWAATKEVWFDRATKRPFLVLLYDDDGRVALRAELSDHQPVEVDGQPRERWPMVARVYRLSFPDSGSKITLSLDEVRLRSDEGAPVARSFTMPDPGRAGVSKVVQIDENCGE
jgi:hypothetical protein